MAKQIIQNPTLIHYQPIPIRTSSFPPTINKRCQKKYARGQMNDCAQKK